MGELRWRPRICGGRISPLLFFTNAQARPRRHLHVSGGGRERANAPARLFEDVRGLAITRALCVAAQFGMTPFLVLTYAIHPGSMHRFVGYLEGAAVQTYDNLVTKTATPGTQLHDDAKWVDCLQHMLADESHHR